MYTAQKRLCLPRTPHLHRTPQSLLSAMYLNVAHSGIVVGQINSSWMLSKSSKCAKKIHHGNYISHNPSLTHIPIERLSWSGCLGAHVLLQRRFRVLRIKVSERRIQNNSVLGNRQNGRERKENRQVFFFGVSKTTAFGCSAGILLGFLKWDCQWPGTRKA